jgi:hypothetical protein
MDLRTLNDEVLEVLEALQTFRLRLLRFGEILGLFLLNSWLRWVMKLVFGMPRETEKSFLSSKRGVWGAVLFRYCCLALGNSALLKDLKGR